MSELSSRGKPAAPPSPSRGRLFLKTVPPVAGLEAVSQSLDSPCLPLSVVSSFCVSLNKVSGTRFASVKANKVSGTL